MGRAEKIHFERHYFNNRSSLPATQPCRLAAQRKLLKEENQLCRNEEINECESPNAAPVVMVPKKDGSTRFCMDYRRLKDLTISDKYPNAKNR